MQDKNWVFICNTTDVATDTCMQILVEGFPPLAVVNIDDSYYVIDDTCTHGKAFLTDGYLEGYEIECPFHAGRFDVRTGEVTAPPCTIPLKVYSVKIEDGKIYASPE
ncbi:non-heme iron oxygenase ferredoxin subunit [Tepidiphilus succinatimandens]|uniref:non-heme iron oxygenase ferredoxin subunit n=1 Tax=Tepidiphilus succinatimandens TaxID=224436 RepID=UPI00112EFC06|nr:non-heme iron oxygenase ferredoxin subunit [Tepidiphilus succinatimandens]